MERVADYIIRKIKEAGAEHIFLVSGRGILYLTDAVARNAKIDHICTYHEQGASYAAMAYSEINGLAACLVSTGCAATNAVTACLCAYQDNLPVIFVSGNNHLEENSRFTGIDIRTYGSQEADIVKIVSSCTKYAVMLEDKNRVVYETEKAIFTALDGRKGPVWIDVPLDVQNMRIEESEQSHYFADPNGQNEEIDEKIAQVAETLEKANRPILLIGGGTQGLSDEIAEFVEKLRIPVVFSPKACDVYGSYRELSIGAVGSIGGSRAGNFTIQNADFVLAIGTKLCSQETGQKELFARNAYVAVVDIDETEHTKEGINIDCFINDHAKSFIDKLSNKIKHLSVSEWVDKCKHWKELFTINNEIFIKELKDKDEIDIYQLADCLSDILPDNATIITDAGFEELIIPSTIRYKDGQKCLFPAAQGAMGYALPAVIGAFCAGRKNIVCVVGDGSFMMNMQELQIISSLNIPAKICVINNNMYAVIRKRQTDLFRNRTIGVDPSDGVPSCDFKKMSDCFGLNYKCINSSRRLGEELKKVISDDGLELIEIISTDQQMYLHESYGLDEKRRLVHRPIEDMAPFLERNLIKREMLIEMAGESYG